MDWLTVVAGVLGTVIGASISLVATSRSENRRIEAEARARWESNLLRVSSDLAVAARGLLHVAGRPGRLLDSEQRASRLDVDLQRVRETAEQLRLIGNVEVQTAARMVRRYAFEVRMICEKVTGASSGDLYDKDRQEWTLLNGALRDFYRAVRSQLGFPKPADVIDDALGYELDAVERDEQRFSTEATN